MTNERAVLAGGCFWGVQELFRERDGVISTRVGYTGGDNENPTYQNRPGHAEAVEIVFDPQQISYRDILEFLFQIHDPTTKDRQGNDIGTSYRSEIFYTTDEQRRVAEETIADADANANADPNADANADRMLDAGSVRQPWWWHLCERQLAAAVLADANADPDANTYADTDANSDSDAYTNADTHPDAYAGSVYTGADGN